MLLFEDLVAVCKHLITLLKDEPKRLYKPGAANSIWNIHVGRIKEKTKNRKIFFAQLLLITDDEEKFNKFHGELRTFILSKKGDTVGKFTHTP